MKRVIEIESQASEVLGPEIHTAAHELFHVIPHSAYGAIKKGVVEQLHKLC